MPSFFQWFKSSIKVLILLVVIWFVGRAILNSTRHVNWAILTIKPYHAIGGFLILLCSNIFGAWIQRTFYRKLGFVFSWSQGFSLYTIPQLAKYLPGKFWTVIGYSGIAKSFNVPVSVSGSGVFVLTGWGLAGASLLGIILVLINPATLSGQEMVNLRVLLLIVALLFIFFHPRLYVRIVNVVLILFKKPPISLQFPWRTMLEIVGGSFVLNSLYFLGLALMTVSIVELPFAVLPLLIGIFCLANVVGFLAVFAPAGIGVREGILLLLLGPLVGAGMASVIAILARLIQTAADIFSTAFGLISFYCGKKGKAS